MKHDAYLERCYFCHGWR